MKKAAMPIRRREDNNDYKQKKNGFLQQALLPPFWVLPWLPPDAALEHRLQFPFRKPSRFKMQIIRI